jgi:hypothetical protein
MQFDTVIVGAGVSGLYFANRYSQSGRKAPVAIFEKSNTFGGRIQTHQTNKGFFDLGAARFNSIEHPILGALVKQYDLETLPFDPAIKLHQNKKIPYFNFPTLIEDKISFSAWIKGHYGEHFLDDLIAQTGYDVLSNGSLSFHEGSRIINEHPETVEQEKNNWRKFSNGFYSLTNKLYDCLVEQKFSLYFSHELISLQKIEGGHELVFFHEGRLLKVYSTHVVLAVPKDALSQISCNIGLIQNVIGSIQTVPLFKLLLCLDKKGWSKFNEREVYLTTHLPLRRVYFSENKNEILIYCDSESATYWHNEFHQYGKFKTLAKIRNNLAHLLEMPLAEIPMPVEFYYRYWPHGVSFLNRHGKVDFPFVDEGLYLISDMFSSLSGWVEGALRNAKFVFDNYFSKYNRTAQSKVLYGN